MTKPVAWSIAGFFAAVSGCLIWMTFFLTQQIYLLRMDISGQVDKLITMVDQRTGEILVAANVTAQKSDDRIASIQKDANKQLTDLQSNLTATLRPVSDQAAGALSKLSGAIEQVSSQATPSLQAANKLLGDTDLFVRGAQPEAVGLLRDTRLASAELARTSIYLRQQTPQFLNQFSAIELDIKKSTESSVQASAATAAMMKNLQKATAPLPSWIRIPLSITGAVAPTAAGAISAAAATGAFQK